MIPPDVRPKTGMSITTSLALAKFFHDYQPDDEDIEDSKYVKGWIELDLEVLARKLESIEAKARTSQNP